MIKFLMLISLFLYQSNRQYTINFDKLDLNSAVIQAVESNKNILLIFSIEDCEFCRILEKDLSTLNTENYIVCIIDTTSDKRVANSFGVRIFPTSLIISVSNNNHKIIDSIIGYSNKTYKQWLEKNNDKNNTK